MVLVKALIFDRDHRFLHNVRNLREINARADLFGVIAQALRPFRIVHAVYVQGIRHIHKARFLQFKGSKACVHLHIVVAPDDGRHTQAHKAAGDDADAKHRLEELAEHGKHRMCRAAGRAGRFAVCTAHGSSARLRRVVLIDVFFQHV